MKNIFVLPTDKPSRLYYSCSAKNYHLLKQPKKNAHYRPTQNIYITSNEKLENDDWCICSEGEIHKVLEIKSDIGIIRFTDGVTEVLASCKKIILTTDPQLIKDEVQPVNDEVLEWFVKNPWCKKIEVLRYNNIEPGGRLSYEIPLRNLLVTEVNPNNQEVMFHKERQEYFYEDIIHDKLTTVWLGKEYSIKKEPIHIPYTGKVWEPPKQETVEEAGERLLADNIDGLKDALQDDDLFYFYKDVIKLYGQEMIKWQQERSYSEEEVLDILHKYNLDEPSDNKGWFEEQFKKK